MRYRVYVKVLVVVSLNSRILLRYFGIQDCNLYMKNARRLNRELITREALINNLLTGHALDISPEGMFINVNAEIKPGTPITLKFYANVLSLVVKSVVRHSQPGIGIGLQFIGLNEVQRTGSPNS